MYHVLTMSRREWALEWHDALGLQRRLLDDWSRYPLNPVLLTEPFPDWDTMWEDVAEERIRYLRRAEPMWVSEDMVRLVETAVESLPSHPLQEQDLLVPVCFAVLERPLIIPDHQGHLRPATAFLWHPMNILVERGVARPGLLVSAFMDRGRPPYLPPEIDSRFDEFGWGRLFPYVTTTWPWGQVVDSPKVSDERWKESVIIMRRFVMTLWLLANQRLAIVTGRRPPRGYRRAAERAGMPSEVKVVTLRRPEPKVRFGDVVAHPVEWSHRWLVSGHWRRYWSERDGRVKVVWVRPHIKGPSDKPFIPKRRVFRFVR